MHCSNAFRARLWHQNAPNPTYGHTEIDPPEKAALNSSALLFLSLFIPLHTPQKKCFSLFFPRTLPFALSPAPGRKYMEKYWKERRRSRGANLNENNDRKIICAILLLSRPVLVDFRQLYILLFRLVLVDTFSTISSFDSPIRKFLINIFLCSERCDAVIGCVE